MEKKMKLVMNENLSLELFVDGQVKMNIPKENREISAKDIYDCFNYSKGDKYIVEKDYGAQNTEKIVDSLEKLLVDIATQLNAMSGN